MYSKCFGQQGGFHFDMHHLNQPHMNQTFLDLSRPQQKQSTQQQRHPTQQQQQQPRQPTQQQRQPSQQHSYQQPPVRPSVQQSPFLKRHKEESPTPIANRMRQLHPVDTTTSSRRVDTTSSPPVDTPVKKNKVVKEAKTKATNISSEWTINPLTGRPIKVAGRVAKRKTKDTTPSIPVKRVKLEPVEDDTVDIDMDMTPVKQEDKPIIELSVSPSPSLSPPVVS